MKRIFVSFCVCFFLLSISSAVAGESKFQEGKWQITISIDMPGMPFKLPTQTFTQCLTKKNYIPQQEEPNQHCKTLKFNAKGDTATWVVECKDKEGVSIISGRAVYKGNTLEGVVKVKTAEEEITQKLKGKWIGKCP